MTSIDGSLCASTRWVVYSLPVFRLIWYMEAKSLREPLVSQFPLSWDSLDRWSGGLGYTIFLKYKVKHLLCGVVRRILTRFLIKLYLIANRYVLLVDAQICLLIPTICSVWRGFLVSYVSTTSRSRPMTAYPQLIGQAVAPSGWKTCLHDTLMVGICCDSKFRSLICNRRRFSWGSERHQFRNFSWRTCGSWLVSLCSNAYLLTYTSFFVVGRTGAGSYSVW